MCEHHKTTQASPDSTSTGYCSVGTLGGNIAKQEKKFKAPTMHNARKDSYDGAQHWRVQQNIKNRASFDSFVSPGVTSCLLQETDISRVYPWHFGMQLNVVCACERRLSKVFKMCEGGCEFTLTVRLSVSVVSFKSPFRISQDIRSFTLTLVFLLQPQISIVTCVTSPRRSQHLRWRRNHVQKSMFKSLIFVMTVCN